MRIIIESSPHLNILLAEQIHKIVHVVEVKLFPANSVVIEAGTELGQSLWLVVKGKLSGIPGGHTSIGDEAFATKSQG